MRILLASLLLLAYHYVHGQSPGSGDEGDDDVQELLARVEAMLERIEGHEEVMHEALGLLDNINRNVKEVKGIVEEEQERGETVVPAEPAESFASNQIGNTELRLVGPSFRGRLEVYHNDEWGTVCDDDFTAASAVVFCKALGLPHANARGVDNFGGGEGKPIMLDQVTCGSSTNAKYCTHAGWGIHNCQHGEDLGLRCI